MCWLTSVQNAFFTAPLPPPNFSIYRALVVDLLHEFELGTWKRSFIHLIRLLEAIGGAASALTAELDHRFALPCKLQCHSAHWISLVTGPPPHLVGRQSVNLEPMPLK